MNDSSNTAPNFDPQYHSAYFSNPSAKMLQERRVARLVQDADRSLPCDPLAARRLLTDALAISSYDPDLWHQRAIAHIKLGYPDLAIGDAYRALLLVQELLEAHEESEFGFEGLIAWRGRRAQPRDTYSTENPPKNGISEPLKTRGDDKFGEQDLESIPELSDAEERDLRRTDIDARRIISSSLLEIGCALDALEQADAAAKLYPEDTELKRLLEEADFKVQAGRAQDLSDSELRGGQAKRVIYPWNTFEPDRTSTETVEYLNKFVSEASFGNFEARVTELPVLFPDPDSEKLLKGISRQLGVYATKDLVAGAKVFSERSILTVNNRLFDPLCDCCNGPLDPLQCLSCTDCDDVMFCSEQCKNEALEKYHPALCGIDIDFLFKSAHTVSHDVANDASATASSSTPTKALYSLLLLRTLAMALTQDVNPLELLPVKYLYGSSPPPPPPQSPPTLPFTFSDNILSVFHILTRLEVDPFKVSLHTFDIWQTLTIHSKILGTASARHNPTSGQPEVAALHLCYSLVNHDCEPCLMWECQSEMKFRTLREVKKGEEVRDCYTDPRIESWRKRREWLLGSLGGGCRCARCVRESEVDP